MTQRQHALVLAAFGLISIACGGPRQRTRLGREQTETEIAAPAPAAPQYATAPPEGAAVTGGAHLADVQAGIAAAGAARSVTLTGDPRLGTLAEWLSERLSPAGDPPPGEVIDFFGSNLGLTDPTPHVIVLGLPERASIATEVERSVTQFLARQTYTHWGANIVPRDGVWAIVIVLSWRHLELQPIARQMQTGPIRVQGRLASGFSNPVVAVQAPGTGVTRIPAGAGPEIDVRVPAAERGAYRVEVLATGPLGPSVLANAPVYVGVDPPRSVRLDLEEDAGPAPDVATLRQQLFDLLNQTRRDGGVPLLELDERLDEVALAHSQDMLTNDFLGHSSPTTGTAGDRLQRAGIRSGLVLENIGRGYTASEIHRGLLDSPGHRANIVNPAATHVGIGVIPQEENGRVAFIVTQVFIQVARPIDVAAAPALVLERLNRARTARGAPAMRMENNLSQAAQNAAQTYFTDPSATQQDTVNQATGELRRFAIAYRRLGGVMAVVSSLEEATQLEPALDDSVAVCGIGVAQGTRPDSGPNAIAVVIVLGWER